MAVVLRTQQIADDDPRYEELDAFLDSISGEKGIALLALQKAQHVFSFLPLEVHKHISSRCGISVAELYGVSSFYSQFRLEPEGKHQIAVCLGTACYVRGSQLIVDRIAQELGVAVGKTTQDGLFSLKAARCLGCCGLSPVMMIDDDVYAKLDNLDEIPAILERYRSAEKERQKETDSLNGDLKSEVSQAVSPNASPLEEAISDCEKERQDG